MIPRHETTSCGSHKEKLLRAKSHRSCSLMNDIAILFFEQLSPTTMMYQINMALKVSCISIKRPKIQERPLQYFFISFFMYFL